MLRAISQFRENEPSSLRVKDLNKFIGSSIKEFPILTHVYKRDRILLCTANYVYSIGQSRWIMPNLFSFFVNLHNDFLRRLDEKIFFPSVYIHSLFYGINVNHTCARVVRHQVRLCCAWWCSWSDVAINLWSYWKIINWLCSQNLNF